MLNKLKKNDRIKLTIESIAAGGEGVARAGDFVVFVPFSAPGDVAEVRLEVVKKNYATGKTVNLLTPSSLRVAPFCNYFGECGGCTLQHINYAAQLEIKRKIVADNITRIGKLPSELVLPVISMKKYAGYRNKVQFVAGGNRNLTLGLYRKNTHNLIPIKSCPLQPELSNSILDYLLENISFYKWNSYDEKTGKGILRHVIIRTNFLDEVLLVLVVSSMPANVKDFADKIMSDCPCVKSIVININRRRDNIILGDEFKLINGSGFIYEKVLSRKFKISSGSFFQVNTEGASVLARIVTDALTASGAGSVCDAYCGSGFFSMFLSEKFEYVLGIEEFSPAVQDAVENAKLNKITNTEFIAGQTENVLLERIDGGDVFDAIVFDPPRKGLTPEIIEKVSQTNIPAIVYVSCNPSTLARDLAIFNNKGYSPKFIQPVDMFPQTAHVECVTLMSRVKE